MFRNISIALILVVVTSSSAGAIGSSRRGITIGGSIGYAPIIAWDRTVDGKGGPSTGPTTSIMLGYGVDDRNTFVFEGTTAHAIGNSVNMNFTGVRWYAFARTSAPSSFFACGLGWSSLVTDEDASVFNVIIGDSVNLPAATIGFGYEPVRWQLIGLYVNAGRQEGFTLVNVSLMFTIMAY